MCLISTGSLGKSWKPFLEELVLKIGRLMYEGFERGTVLMSLKRSCLLIGEKPVLGVGEVEYVSSGHEIGDDIVAKMRAKITAEMRLRLSIQLRV
jgi:hypothetical protein